MFLWADTRLYNYGIPANKEEKILHCPQSKLSSLVRNRKKKRSQCQLANTITEFFPENLTEWTDTNDADTDVVERT